MNYDPNSSRSIRQKECIQKWIDSGCRACLQLATGFGKTWIAILCIKRFLEINPKCKVDIIVPTKFLKNQWSDLLKEQGLNKKCTVWVVNTAIRKTHKTDFLIIDEIHRFASDSFFKIFNSFGYSMILGLTATIERLDGKETYITAYCPVVDIVTMDEAVANGWLATSKIYKVIIDVPDIHIYREYEKQFMSSFSFFDFDFNLAMSCLTSVHSRRDYCKQLLQWNDYFDKNDKTRCDQLKELFKECTSAVFQWNTALKKRKEFVFHHPKKFEIANKILQNRPFSKAITFNATIKDCESYGFGYVIHSKNTNKQNETLLRDFNKAKYGVIHSSKSLNEGADIKGLNLAVILYNSSSSIERIQRYGRVIRAEEGKVAEIFSIIIRDTVEDKWFKKSAKNTDFIEIDESDLDAVLDYEKIQRVIHKQEDVKHLMTY